jgi:hypothetical protein
MAQAVDGLCIVPDDASAMHSTFDQLPEPAAGRYDVAVRRPCVGPETRRRKPKNAVAKVAVFRGVVHPCIFLQ